MLARTFRILLNKSGESGHPYLVPGLEEKVFSIPLFSIILATGFI
jgi:hypothetical protein